MAIEKHVTLIAKCDKCGAEMKKEGKGCCGGTEAMKAYARLQGWSVGDRRPDAYCPECREMIPSVKRAKTEGKKNG